MHRHPHYAENVRKIAEQALNDAIEITLLVSLLREYQKVKKQAETGAARQAARVNENALLARLILLTARAYSRNTRHGDLHVQRAACLLKDNTTRQIIGIGDGAENLKGFEAHWLKCRGDHRRPKIEAFRDKFTAHLGEPKNLDEATYKEVFEFGLATAEAMQMLAIAVSGCRQAHRGGSRPSSIASSLLGCSSSRLASLVGFAANIRATRNSERVPSANASEELDATQVFSNSEFQINQG